MAEAGEWAGRMGRDWASQIAALERQLAPAGEIALAALDPKPGERVIDLGCGSGPTAERIAQAVGPEGRVLGVDISAELVEMATAKLKPFDHADVVRADAETHSFTETYDTLFTRFGCMFFENPPAAMTNLRKALKPGGRAVLTVWGDPKANPWAGIPARVAETVLGPVDPPPPGAPGPFAWAEEEISRPILEAAGFTDISYESHDLTLEIGEDTPADPVSRAISVFLAIGPLARRLREEAETGKNLAHYRTAVVGGLTAALGPHVRDDWVRLAGRIWVIRAKA